MGRNVVVNFFHSVVKASPVEENLISITEVWIKNTASFIMYNVH